MMIGLPVTADFDTDPGVRDLLVAAFAEKLDLVRSLTESQTSRWSTR